MKKHIKELHLYNSFGKQRCKNVHSSPGYVPWRNSYTCIKRTKLDNTKLETAPYINGRMDFFCMMAHSQCEILNGRGK